jgi:hypothetical protein
MWRAPWLAPRVQPVPGRRLAAADLRDLLALADQQRRRHVRALHATWGIAAGLDVEHEPGRGFVVRPGVAYDICGRLVVIGASVALAGSDELPGPRLVVVRADRAAGEPAATVRVVAEAEVELGLDVPLGLLDPDAATAQPGVRRHAAGAAPVILAAGLVRHGTAVATGVPRHWSAWIDTTAAGFPALPVYVAGLAAGGAPAGVGVATVQIGDARPDGFEVQVRRAAAGTAGLDAQALTTTPEDVTWIAALPQEPAAVVEPLPQAGPCTGARFTEEDA